jgi:hypothetical protein
MGYFSNGTEGDMYEENWCERCLHKSEGEGCAVMLAHLVFNYEQHKDDDLKNVLDTLIPSEGAFNAECAMYMKSEPVFVIFDGPPSHESGRFIEVENEQGESLGPQQTGADWKERSDGNWTLGPFWPR